jgi:hypothetical protein
VTALILGALIAVAAVVIVSLPFLRDSGEPELLDTAQTEEALALMEIRDRAVGALRELEFDHRTGKVDDVDYRTLVGPLRRSVAEALQALDRVGKGDSGEQRVAEQEDVQRDDQPRDHGRNRRREPAVDERAHEVAARGEADQGDQGERDPEGENDL